MIKLGSKKDGGEKITEKFEIDNELSIIIEKNMLPPRIAEKIGEKIKENNIKISKEQLYKLVEKIQSVMSGHIKPIQSKHKEYGKNEITTDEESADMKKLVEAVEQLEERIKTIEENRLEGVKGVTGKLVKTGDIMIAEKIDTPLHEEEMHPLLEIPNDPESIIVLMKWLQYLVDKIGKTHLPDVLGYYVDIDWISDDVRLDLIKYSKGVTEEGSKTATRKESSNLPTRDHLQSLLFIQKLKGIQLDERFMRRIDREMEKMTKSLDDYQPK